MRQQALLVLLFVANVCTAEEVDCGRRFFNLGDGAGKPGVITDGNRVELQDLDKFCQPYRVSCLNTLSDGDEVVFIPIDSDRACVLRFNPGNTTGARPIEKGEEAIGKVPLQRIKPKPIAERGTLDPWLGQWTASDNSSTITIKAASKPGAVLVSGEATWHGGKNMDGNDIVHMGDIGGEAYPQSKSMLYVDNVIEGVCVAYFELMGDGLAVTDDGQCGGANVGFTGNYVRSSNQQLKRNGRKSRPSA